MQVWPNGWMEAREGYFRMESKVEIAGVEHGEEDIFSLSTNGALFSDGTVSVGNCVAKEIDLEVMPKGEIPRMAEIKVFVRPVADGVDTDWLQKGVFYIDTRQEDKVTGVVTIHGYDSMLKAEQVYREGGDTGEWPRSMQTVVNEIAQRMGVEVDPRTGIDSSYMVEYPNDLTMREVLGYIAVAHAGNWIITDAGKLRLVGLTNAVKTTDYLMDEDGYAITFGGVRIVL